MIGMTCAVLSCIKCDRADHKCHVYLNFFSGLISEQESYCGNGLHSFEPTEDIKLARGKVEQLEASLYILLLASYNIIFCSVHLQLVISVNLNRSTQHKCHVYVNFSWSTKNHKVSHCKNCTRIQLQAWNMYPMDILSNQIKMGDNEQLDIVARPLKT